MKKLLNFRPILFIALSLCCGICTAYFLVNQCLIWVIVFGASFLLALVLFLTVFTSKTLIKRNVIFSLIFILFFTVGALGLNINLSRYERANLGGRNYDVSAKITNIKESETGCYLTLSNAEIKGNRTGKLYYKIALSVYGKIDLEIGDIVSFNANLYDKTYKFEDRFNANDIERKIKYTASISADEIIKTGEQRNLFEQVRIFIKNALKTGLDEKEFPVGLALLTGDSSFIDNDLISSYRYAGVAHIFAVSGLHIGFLAGVLIFIFKKIKIPDLLKTIIIGLVLLFYSGVCSFSASSIRATIMTVVSLFAVQKGQRYDAITALSFSAIIILLLSPVQLLCVGFQLSFAVVFGIVLLSRPIVKVLKFLPKKLAKSLGVVLSAQIFSMPICLYAFGYVSTISVAINLLFIPIVSVVYILTLIATIFGGIFAISQITLFPSNYIFKLFNFLITILDYDFFIFGGIVLGGGALCYYLIAFILSGFFNLKTKSKIITSTVLAITMVLSMVITNIINYNSVKIYVSSSDSISATYISYEDENTLVVSDVNHVYSLSRIKRIVDKTQETHLNSVVILGGYTVDLQVFLTKLLSVFSVDNVYYYGEKQQSMEQVCQSSFPKIKFYNFEDNTVLPIKNFNPKTSLDGKVLIGDISGRKTAIFSRLGQGNINFLEIGTNFDLMICLDRADGILNAYSPKTAISYKYSNIYINAVNYGNILMKLT